MIERSEVFTVVAALVKATGRLEGAAAHDLVKVLVALWHFDAGLMREVSDDLVRQAEAEHKKRYNKTDDIPF